MSKDRNNGQPTGDEATQSVASSKSKADAQFAAIRLLSAREHGRQELIRKLIQRGWTPDESESVVDDLAAQGLQSDQRFAESFVRSRAQKAHGPVRIRAELSERGLDRSEIERALQAEPFDWLAIASRWYERRYGTDPATDQKERSRRQQALARRGFTSDVVRELVN